MENMKDYKNMIIEKLEVIDMRFPTSLHKNAPSDAVHTHIDFSCAYVILHVSNCELEGKGYTFTLGRGTEIICHAIQSLRFLVEGKSLSSIFSNFRLFWRSLTNESQLRWLGPEKGVTHLAVAAIVNSIWDIWAKLESKPLWKLIVDMEPEQLVQMIDFHHITDCLTEAEALGLLKQQHDSKKSREMDLLKNGLPAYVTSIGWMGYSNEQIEELCTEALKGGWTSFKMKVGVNIKDDVQRARLIRTIIGPENQLMMDANQVWEVNEAIDNMKELAEFNPVWIEEPTHPDDIQGHVTIANALAPYNIGVATGEHCQNRIIFKQLISSGAIQFCQIDACRLGGVNEVLAVMLMAAKFKVPICPHAGGVGLCELVQHLAAINSICIAPTNENTIVEFADHLHEHFENPIKVKNGAYLIPMAAGYSSDLKGESIINYQYPNGLEWKKLISQGKHKVISYQ